MEIRNRLFPYPVLCEDTDDYIEGEFSIETSISKKVNSIVLEFDIQLSDPGLQKLVTLGMAEIIIHIECPSTAFRTIIRTYSNSEIYHIADKRINGDVTLLGMIVAAEKIKGYKNKSLNSDYDGMSLSFQKGSILAYYNMEKIHIAKDYEEFAENESVFSVVREISQDANEEKPVWFKIDTNRIQIYVNDAVYIMYSKYQYNDAMNPMILSLLVFPALTFVIEELRNNTIELYESKYWFQKLKKSWEIRGGDFEGDVIDGGKNISEIAQEMLQLPISRSILNIPLMLGD